MLVNMLSADCSMDRIDQLVNNPDEPINPSNTRLDFWARLRDDILMIWTGSIDQLTQFMTWLNGICQSLKFTYTHSPEGVKFLELFVYVADNFIHTKLFSKKSDTHCYLILHPTPDFFRFMPIFSDPPGIPKISIGKNRKKLKNYQKESA